MYIHKSLLSQDCVASHREYLYLLIAPYAGGQQATHHHTSADWNSSVFVWRNPSRYLIFFIFLFLQTEAKLDHQEE